MFLIGSVARLPVLPTIRLFASVGAGVRAPWEPFEPRTGPFKGDSTICTGGGITVYGNQNKLASDDTTI